MTKVVVIYTTAGTYPIQNDYSHGSRFTCQKVYIHGCRASSIKVLFTRQPFFIPKGLYTRLPCIKYKSAIYTAAVSHAKRYFLWQRIYTRLPGGSPYIKIVIYTAALQDAQPNILYTRLPFVNINCYLHGSRSRANSDIHTAAVCPHKIAIYTEAIQEPNRLYILLPDC